MMLDYSQMKAPGYCWLFSSNQQERVIVEVFCDAGGGFVRFFGKADPLNVGTSPANS